MARKPNPVRIYEARRAAAEGRLARAGMPQEDVEHWLTLWEEHKASEGLDRDDRDYWQRGFDWIDSEGRLR